MFPFSRPAAFICLALTGAAAPVGAWERGVEQLIFTYCLECHDDGLERGDLNLENLLDAPPSASAETWEKVILRLTSRQMPPPDEARPTESEYGELISTLSRYFDQRAIDHPDPGSPDRIRRLTRFEYQNAIRDLLGLELDLTEWLPRDESSHGFDNITLGTLSPTLLNRYLAAAEKISRLALGHAPRSPLTHVVRLPPDQSQEGHVEGLPPGTRGGTAFHYPFPVTGEYDFEIRLTRDRNEEVEGLKQDHELHLLINGELREQFTVKRAQGRDHSKVDAHLKARLRLPAGNHEVTVTFAARPLGLLETKRLPYDAHFNAHRHPRRSPAIYQITLSGPKEAETVSSSPSRSHIFGKRFGDATTKTAHASESDAREILQPLMRRAYRRPIEESDLEPPLRFYREAAAEGGFEAGMEAALAAVLVSPRFLLRVENDPRDLAPGTVYPLDSFALASRLSFFLWSSLPDDRLLDLAEQGLLTQPEVLARETRRMLTDAGASSLITNFVGQWLQLRNVEALAPDLRLFPDFDDNLRQAMRRETELFVSDILERDGSVLELLSAEHSFLNERLAKHYGIPGVRGSRFRRVTFPEEVPRGGLLRHASILSITSYANRTSPVIRGNWILENLLGTPTPPPPPDVPALEDTIVAASLPMRERLAAHSSVRSCATCHDLMDPIGFALENYDATGRWRVLDQERPVDARGGFPDGRRFTGADGIEEALLEQPELFARTVTLKLLTYALGATPEAAHQPHLRRILTSSAENGFRFSDLVVGITGSLPFTHRKTP